MVKYVCANKTGYISCSDSRIPANEIMGLQAGEVFLHWDMANLVPNTDINVISVSNYGIRHPQVKHNVACGHTTVAVKDALAPILRNVCDEYRLHEWELDEMKDATARDTRLVELNAIGREGI